MQALRVRWLSVVMLVLTLVVLGLAGCSNSSSPGGGGTPGSQPTQTSGY